MRAVEETWKQNDVNKKRKRKIRSLERRGLERE
jgi:hypothetical protein